MSQFDILVFTVLALTGGSFLLTYLARQRGWW